MALTAAVIKYDIGANLTPLQGGLRKVQSQVKNSFSKMGQYARRFGLVAAAAVGAYSVVALKTAAEQDLITKKFNVVFKGITKQANIAAESLAEMFVITTGDAQNLLNEVQAVVSSLGLTRTEGLAASAALAEMAYNLDAFTGKKNSLDLITTALKTGRALSLKQGNFTFESKAEEKKFTKLVEQKKVLEAIAILQKGFPADAKNYASTLTKTEKIIKPLRKGFSQMSEDIGFAIIDSFKNFKGVEDSVKSLLNIFTAVTKKAKAFSEYLSSTREGVKIDGESVTNLQYALNTLAEAWKSILPIIKTVVKYLASHPVFAKWTAGIIGLNLLIPGLAMKFLSLGATAVKTFLRMSVGATKAGASIIKAGASIIKALFTARRSPPDLFKYKKFKTGMIYWKGIDAWKEIPAASKGVRKLRYALNSLGKIPGLGVLNTQLSLTMGILPMLGTAALAVGAAIAGWKIGKGIKNGINEMLGLKKEVAGVKDTNWDDRFWANRAVGFMQGEGFFGKVGGFFKGGKDPYATKNAIVPKGTKRNEKYSTRNLEQIAKNTKKTRGW